MGTDGTLDVTAEQRGFLVRVLKAYLPGVAVWAYGSRTAGTSTPRSDLDLVVFADPRHRYLGPLHGALVESNLPFRVDLHVWDSIPDYFRRNIESSHVVLVPGPSLAEVATSASSNADPPGN